MMKGNLSGMNHESSFWIDFWKWWHIRGSTESFRWALLGYECGSIYEMAKTRKHNEFGRWSYSDRVFRHGSHQFRPPIKFYRNHASRIRHSDSSTEVVSRSSLIFIVFDTWNTKCFERSPRSLIVVSSNLTDVRSNAASIFTTKDKYVSAVTPTSSYKFNDLDQFKPTCTKVNWPQLFLQIQKSCPDNVSP